MALLKEAIHNYVTNPNLATRNSLIMQLQPLIEATINKHHIHNFNIDDLTQEIYLQILEWIERTDKTKITVNVLYKLVYYKLLESFRRLSTIPNSQYRTMMKRHKRIPSIFGTESVYSDELFYYDDHSLFELRELLSSIVPNKVNRYIMMRTIIDKDDFVSISRELQMNKSTVYFRYKQCINKVRQYLQEL